MSDETVTVSMSRNQARVVQNACEEYMRLRFGQYSRFADDIASMAYPDREDFPKMIELRNAYQETLEASYPVQCKYTTIPEDVFVAETVYDALRSAAAWHDHPDGIPHNTDFFPMYSRCAETLPVVEFSERMSA